MHDITLPRSWLLRFRKLDGLEKRDTRMLAHLVRPLADLLESVYNGAGEPYEELHPL